MGELLRSIPAGWVEGGILTKVFSIASTWSISSPVKLAPTFSSGTRVGDYRMIPSTGLSQGNLRTMSTEPRVRDAHTMTCFAEYQANEREGTTTAHEYARSVVAEVTKRNPRAWFWTGATTSLVWFGDTFLPRWIWVRRLSQ